MAKKQKIFVQKEDIPAWFMTYSDVITLLMTFFILLLTFSTTEPERFEKVRATTFSAGGATGLIGKKIEGPDDDSWVNRIRPPAARIAMRGAEMPPIMREPFRTSFGKGLKSLDPDQKRHNEMTSHYFEIELTRLFDSQGKLTSQGKYICQSLSAQLRDLPFQAAFQFVDKAHTERVVQMMTYMFEEQNTRPGQIGMSLVKDADLAENKVRILIKRYLGNRS